MRDPYETLGVDRAADDAEVKAAFRRAAARHHPDRNRGDPDAQRRFTEINGAYQILGDPEKRAAYDRHGSAAFETRGTGGPRHAGVGGVGDLESILGDLLGAFGFRSAGSNPRPRHTLHLSFEEAALGCTKELAYETLDLCADCSGRGSEPGTLLQDCRVCYGHGRVRLTQGAFMIGVERPCPACGGRGRIPSVACGRCAGKGLTRQQRSVPIEVPPGLDTGAVRTIRGAGHRLSPDHPPGDLEVVVEVAPHATFRRSGDSIKSRIPVRFTVAALGGVVQVPTLHGETAVKVPAGTQPGDVIELKGLGIPRRRGGRGQHLVSIEVMVPKSMSSRARGLVAEVDAELRAQEERRSSGVLGRLRKVFG